MKNLAMRNLFGLLVMLGATASGVQAAGFDEGIEYLKISPAVPTSSGAKVEVVELFWYGCPHCFHLEPKLHNWLEKKPDNVEFVRVPAIFNPQWAASARAYYTAEILGVLDKIHAPMFEAIHVKKRKLYDEKSLAAFFAEHGVKEADFHSTYQSFAVDTKLRRAIDLTKRYKIDGVPSMAVNGKYLTHGRIAHGQDGMLRVVDFLVKKESGGK